MTARNGAHLRAARLILDAPLDKWLSESVAPESTSLPDRAPDTDEALCVVYMFVLEGRVEGIFQDPDTYCLSLTMEVQVCSPSPVLRLARFVGSNDDADAPAWTRLLQPGKLHYFFQPQTFSAEMICGMTGIHVESISSCDISTRMCLWARTVSAGTRVEDDVDAHCRWLNDKDPKAERKPGAPRTRLVRRASPVKPKKLAALSVPPTRSTKLVHRVTCAPIRQPLGWFHPTTAPLQGTVWAQFSPLRVQIWEADTYLSGYGPDTLIDLQDIISHAQGAWQWHTLLMTSPLTAIHSQG
ncbi:hypothetical protein C8R47DRAFT_1282477 [Mycena vitilis]|nr:hypothetical protein C8R47DRAFT_1282477 [Mycena vitilis]